MNEPICICLASGSSGINIYCPARRHILGPPAATTPDAPTPGELLPCPFCGAAPLPDSYYADQGDKWGRVVCGCGAYGPDTRTEYDLSEDAAWHGDAADLWNRRPSLPPPAATTPDAPTAEALVEAFEEAVSAPINTSLQYDAEEVAEVNRTREALLAALRAAPPASPDVWAEPDFEPTGYVKGVPVPASPAPSETAELRAEVMDMRYLFATAVRRLRDLGETTLVLPTGAAYSLRVGASTPEAPHA